MCMGHILLNRAAEEALGKSNPGASFYFMYAKIYAKIYIITLCGIYENIYGWKPS